MMKLFFEELKNNNIINHIKIYIDEKIFARFKRIDNRLRPLPYTELLKDSYSTGSVVGGSLKIRRYS